MFVKRASSAVFEPDKLSQMNQKLRCMIRAEWANDLAFLKQKHCKEAYLLDP